MHTLEAIFGSFSLIALNEMGDRTQLLALALAARYRKPGLVMTGILLATLFNHAMAVMLGAFGAEWLSGVWLSRILGGLFIAFGIWALFPDQEGDADVDAAALKAGLKPSAIIWSTAVAFFFAEMGDKTQFATIALGARFNQPFAVLAGSTLGMLFADGIAVFLGHRFAERIHLGVLRKASAVLFLGFGLWTLYSTGRA